MPTFYVDDNLDGPGAQALLNSILQVFKQPSESVPAQPSTKGLDFKAAVEAARSVKFDVFGDLVRTIYVDEEAVRVEQSSQSFAVVVKPGETVTVPAASVTSMTMNPAYLRAGGFVDMGVVKQLSSAHETNRDWANDLVKEEVKRAMADIHRGLTPLVVQLLTTGGINHRMPDGSYVQMLPKEGVTFLEAKTLNDGFGAQLATLTGGGSATLWVHPAVFQVMCFDKSLVVKLSRNSDYKAEVMLPGGGSLQVNSVNNVEDVHEHGKVLRRFVWPLSKAVLTSDFPGYGPRVILACPIGKESPLDVGGPWVMAGPRPGSEYIAPGLNIQVGLAALPLLTRTVGHTVFTLSEADVTRVLEITGTNKYLA